jgi:F-type H+-transporting ATPase subunit delta
LASEASIPSELADRYAVALYDLAQPENALDAVAADLGALKQALAASLELRYLLANPLIPREKKTDAAVAVAKRYETNALTHKFVGTIGRFGRLAMLGQIIEAFIKLLARRRGELTAEVVSARPLNDNQRQTIERTLTGTAGRNVRLNLRVDPRILGGLQVKLGSRLVDASLATKLDRLRLAMKGSA